MRHIRIGIAFSFAAAISCGESTPPPTATQLDFDVQPSSATAGAAIAPAITVRVLDASGNVVTSATNEISISITDDAGTIDGSLIATAVAGVATFTNIQITTAATHTLTASAAGLDSAVSDEFTISPGAPAAMVFAQQPTSGAGGQVLAPLAVHIRDQFGNTASSTAAVTLSISTNPSQGTLIGTTTLSANAGVAEFSVRIDRPGIGYRLTASSTGLTPIQGNAFDVTLTFASISAGGSFLASGQSSGHTCGVTTGGIGYCWGANAFGQLGNGNTTDQSRPTLVSGGHVWAQITAGGHHTCGITPGAAATVYCWGRNSNGQAGPVAVASQLTPAFVMTTGSTSPQHISAGDMYTCIASGFNATCWGLNSSGQLGDGTTTDRSQPTQVTGGFNAPFARISAGGSHTCGIYSASGGAALWCWGSAGSDRKLGNGSSAGSSSPVSVSSGGASGTRTYLDIAVGADHSCALEISANVYCWGAGANAQIGNGSQTSQFFPSQAATLPGPSVTLTAGWNHNCAIVAGGTLYCWGLNANNQLGDGTTSNRATPVAIGGSLTFNRVDAAADHTCGVTTTGVAFCWGINAAGQLGDGSTTQRAIPTRVIQ
jgi:alpha-tubulin suppressor-like RCC1 family protein